MKTHLNCLVVEDDPLDFQLLEQHLQPAIPPVRCRRVDRLMDFRAALAEGGWDLIISDYTVPGQDIQDTLAHLRARQSDLPVILVSGSIGEEKAVDLLKQGVADFVLKEHLGRLLPVIEACLRETAGRRARLAAEERYRSLFDHMLNGCARGRLLFEQDQPRDFVYLAVNQAFEDLTGLKNVVGRRLTEVVPGLLAGNPQFLEPYGRVVRTGITEKYESFVVAVQQWFAVALYRTAPDEFTAVFDIITERKQAEAALRRSEAFNQAVLDSVTSHLAVLDPSGVILAVNARWREFARANAPAGSPLPPRTGPGTNYLAICGASPTADARAANAGIADVIAGRQERFALEYPCDSPQEKRWFMMDVTRLGAGPEVVVSHTNITERRRSEELLRESEQQFRVMFETAAVGMAQTDPLTGQFLRVNRKLCAITGYPEPELLRLRVPDITHPADRAANGQLFPACPGGEAPANHVEKRYLRQDGTLAWVAINATLICDDAGQPVRSLAVIEDITARHEAEAEIAQEQARFKLIFDSVPIGIAYAVVQPDGSFQRISNEAHLKIYGLTRAQDGELGIYQRITEPEDYVRQQALANQLGPDRVGSYTIEKRCLRPDGQVVWVDFSYKRQRLPDGSFEDLTTVVDITERRAKTEELLWKTAFLEALVHSSADGILVVDNKRRKVLQNQKLIDFWHLPPDVAANPDDRQQFAFALTQARDPALLQAQFQRVTEHPDAPDQAEIELKDGTILDRYTAQVRGSDGQVYGRVWTFHNITNARRLEAQYRQAQKMEAIGTLAGGIAHDFNNILCSMFGYGYLAQQETASQPLAQEYLAEILRAASRAKDLVQQILTFSRQREQKREVIRLESVIKEASKFLRASLPADLHMEINLADDAPPVLADPTQIYQVVMNLTTNALHAMEGRPARLIITLAAFTPNEPFRQAHPEIPPRTYTRLTLADNGHGMDARTLERIFEPFFTTKEVGKGTGLGLAVVHGIVQSHEGFITVASQPGQGTTFDLYFPAQADHASSPAHPAVPLPRGAGQQILLLDDEPALTGPFQGLLERLNYRVTCCNLASEALRRFRENPDQFDLIITDLTMPEISGLEVARQLHLIRADLPVILATGYAYSLSPDTMKEAGICELLEKPLGLAVLAEAVRRALAKKSTP